MNPLDPNAPLSFRSLRGPATTELVIERSRFIGYAWPVESVEEIQNHLSALEDEHPEATHIVPAWVIGPGGLQMRAHDDGEPSGTAGVPMLEVLKRENLTDCLIACVRYFGGTKLGAGGLIRAYSRIAVETLQAAGIAQWRQHKSLTLTIPYAQHNVFEHRLGQSTWNLLNTHFDAEVHLDLTIPLDEVPEAEDLFADWSQGQALLSWGTLCYQPDVHSEKERPSS